MAHDDMYSSSHKLFRDVACKIPDHNRHMSAHSQTYYSLLYKGNETRHPVQRGASFHLVLRHSRLPLPHIYIYVYIAV